MISDSKIYVIVPVYGYEPLLSDLIAKIPESVDQVYLIWDKPNEDQLYELQSSVTEKISIHVNEHRKGIGYAMQIGVELTLKDLEDETGVIVLMAGNGKDEPNELTRLVAPIIHDDIQYVQGSRYLSGGKSINLPGPRRIINRVLPMLWSLVLKKRISEVTNGYRAFSSNVFKDQKLIWQRDDLGGYEWEYYINYQLITKGFNHVEVPVTKKYLKDVNHSKIRLKDSYQILRPLVLCPLGRL